MPDTTLRTRIVLRNGTTAQWGTSDLILRQGEVGLELKTLSVNDNPVQEVKIKVGDGTSTWANLAYANVTPAELDAAIATLNATISGAFHFRGVVNTVSDLPASGMAEGDVYQVTYADAEHTKTLNAEYAYNGTEFVELGSIIDLSAYSTTTEVQALIAALEATVVKTVQLNGTALTMTNNAVDIGVKVNGTAATVTNGAVDVGFKVNGTAVALTNGAIDVTSIPVDILVDGTNTLVLNGGTATTA